MRKTMVGAAGAILSLMLILTAVIPAQAASPSEPPAETETKIPDTDSSAGESEQPQEKSGEWKTAHQKVYYYLSGKKVKGLQKIDGKKYYFDSRGVQHTGWQKIKGNYYFFTIANKEKGYMVKDKKVDGVTLKSSGKATLNKNTKSKLTVLVKANQIVEKATKPTMSKSQKLKKTFDYLIKHYKYRGSPKFRKTKNWDRDYALSMFNKKHGSCYDYGAAFAYLANAVGYTKVYAVSSGGHGWAEVNGKIYDPSWHITDKRHSYYGVKPSLSGRGGRPNYKRGRNYVKNVKKL